MPIANKQKLTMHTTYIEGKLDKNEDTTYTKQMLPCRIPIMHRENLTNFFFLSFFFLSGSILLFHFSLFFVFTLFSLSFLASMICKLSHQDHLNRFQRMNLPTKCWRLWRFLWKRFQTDPKLKCGPVCVAKESC